MGSFVHEHESPIVTLRTTKAGKCYSLLSETSQKDLMAVAEPEHVKQQQ
jgi:hypothetical protein